MFFLNSYGGAFLNELSAQGKNQNLPHNCVHFMHDLLG